MANNIKYFIGNWKMFGVPKSIKILNKVNNFVRLDKKNSRNYKVVITPPFTILEAFSRYYKKKSITIGAQNCYHKDNFGSYTGAISPYMIKVSGAKYVIIGHSDNRADGDTDKILREKISFALNNNLKIIYCIGENKIEKAKKKTFSVLKKQLLRVLTKKSNSNNTIVAYEPIWSIGTGKTPTSNDLEKTVAFIKRIFKNSKVLYGGSVDGSSVINFKSLDDLDGFLIGGASKSSKKFIDIIKNYYR
tara:strand:- start:78 stop:818 length:741 start_codon:yes stop_codon:yes gene_type:complete